MQPSYRFGNTSLTFESSDHIWLSYLSERYSSFQDPFPFQDPFQNDPVNAFVVHFECTAARRPEGLTSPLSTYVEAPVIETHEHGFTARTATTFADVNLDRRRAHLSGPRALYPVDNLFRHLLPALDEQGALVHGATLAKDGQGVLACGPSGAGKSTLAALAGENALCDELSAVFGSEDGYRLTSLPYWQARPGSVDLRAVLLLRHGREHHLEPVSKAAALRQVSSQVLWPVEIPCAMDRALGHVSALLDKVPVFELAFRPDASVWGFIKEHVLS